MFEIDDYEKDSGEFKFGKGGNQGARGSNSGGDFFVENIKEELDYPGEFFFDKATGQLFLYYNGTGAPPTDMEVVVPQLQVLVNQSGTQWDPVKDVIHSGIVSVAERAVLPSAASTSPPHPTRAQTYKSSAYTYMMPHVCNLFPSYI